MAPAVYKGRRKCLKGKRRLPVSCEDARLAQSGGGRHRWALIERETQRKTHAQGTARGTPAGAATCGTWSQGGVELTGGLGSPPLTGGGGMPHSLHRGRCSTFAVDGTLETFLVPSTTSARPALLWRGTVLFPAHSSSRPTRQTADIPPHSTSPCSGILYLQLDFLVELARWRHPAQLCNVC